MNNLLDALDCGVLLLGPGGRIEQVNRWVLDRCRLAPPQAGQMLDAAFGAAVEPRLLKAVHNCLQHGNAVRLSQAFHPTPLPLHRPDAPGDERLRQVVDVIAVAAPATGERLCLVHVRDVSDTVRREQTLRSEVLRLSLAQQEIQRQSLRFSEMARLAPVGMLESDAEGRLVFCNTRAAEQLGVDPEPFHGQPWSQLLAAAGHAADPAIVASHRPAFEFSLERCSRGGSSSLPAASADAATTWLRLEGLPMQLPGQPLAGHLFTLVDVTELREQARRHELRANHDALTGLANRARFEARLQDAVALGRSGQRRACVLFIDLDRFKAVNDTHGHAAGDAVLKAAAARIRRQVRGEDLVARLGGDEFAVLLIDLPDPAVLPALAAAITAAVSKPIAVGDTQVSVGASIGWALFNAQTEDAAEVLARADAAMYEAKRAGRGQRLPAQPA